PESPFQVRVVDLEGRQGLFGRQLGRQRRRGEEQGDGGGEARSHDGQSRGDDGRVGGSVVSIAVRPRRTLPEIRHTTGVRNGTCSRLPAVGAAAPCREGAMRITILTYLEKESATEHDVVVDQVAAALRRRKHTVSVLGVHGNV